MCFQNYIKVYLILTWFLHENTIYSTFVIWIASLLSQPAKLLKFAKLNSMEIGGAELFFIFPSAKGKISSQPQVIECSSPMATCRLNIMISLYILKMFCVGGRDQTHQCKWSQWNTTNIRQTMLSNGRKDFS